MDAAVDVWFCDLASAPPAGAWSWLSPTEQRRAESFVRPADRERYVTAHATMRSLLGDYLQCEPRVVEFAYGPHGRPQLVHGAFDCNLAHSDDRAALAVATGVRVGVDLEHERPNDDMAAIVHRFFAPEERAAFAATDATERTSWFYRQWVAKEAVLKAHGGGLSVPTSGFAVRLAAGLDGVVHSSLGDPGNDWEVRVIDAGRGWHAAVAVDAPLAHVRFTIRAGPPKA